MANVLIVCTANICRSPATETFLEHDVADEIARGLIDVNSFGTQAMPGRAACDLSTALVSTFLPTPSPEHDPARPVPMPVGRSDPDAATGPSSGTAPDPSTATGSQLDNSRPGLDGEPPTRFEHSSRQVTAESLHPADLILALDREHRSALARISPRSRSKTFTLRQAALLATQVHTTISAGQLPQGAPPLPDTSETSARLRWLVEEMDATRGMGSKLAEGDSAEPWHPLDIPDPHVIGYQIHAAVIELIRTETREISSAIQAVLRI